MMRKGVEMYFAPADLARRRKMTARLLADPEPLLRQLGNERSTFDEKDIARVIHRYVDDPADFANIRARLMASPDLVLLKPQQSGALTDPIKGRVNGRVKGEATEPAIFTTRKILRTEHNMMRSADILSGRKGFGISDAGRAAALRFVEEDNPLKPFRLDLEQIEAIQHVTGTAVSLLSSVLPVRASRHCLQLRALPGKADIIASWARHFPARLPRGWRRVPPSDRERLPRGSMPGITGAIS